MIEKQEFFDKNEDYENETLKSRKKNAILFVKLILIQNTNYCKPYSTQDLIRKLDEYPYSISLEKKAVGRIIQTLSEEYPSMIVRTADGRVYYDGGTQAA